MLSILVIDTVKEDKGFIIDTLGKMDPGIYVAGSFDTVSACARWLDINPEPFLVICDWQLGNEDSFQRQCEKIACPFIYTGPVSMMGHANLSKTGVGFIEKPLMQGRIFEVIRKYILVRHHLFRDFEILLRKQSEMMKPKKDFILVRKGQETILLKIDDIAYFCNESRLTFIYDLKGNKYNTDDALVKLQATLDKQMFFRVSKKHLVSINGIKKFKSYGKGKIELTVFPEPTDSIVISQYTAGDFKSWLSG